MTIGRPMNEYESALSAAIVTLIKTVICIGTDREELANNFRQRANDAQQNSRASESALLNIFADIALHDDAFIPKPPLSIVEGGKGDPRSELRD